MIGIFDSGIGGATVFKEILRELPNYKYIYYSDSINNPYGDKSVQELEVITEKVVKELVNRGCKIIVIACNTASAMCKDFLRREFDEPIIAIEPAIKIVHDKNVHEKTLVMATKGTVESDKFQKLYKKYGDNNIFVCECSGLADLIEKGDTEKIQEYLNNNIKQYRGVDNVVLGCTHYPLIKKEICFVLLDVNFYDGSHGVVKELKRVKPSSLEIKFLDSSKDKEKKKRFYNWLKF